MSNHCTQNGSSRITTQDVVKKIGSATGAFASGVTGWTRATAGGAVVEELYPEAEGHDPLAHQTPGPSLSEKLALKRVRQGMPAHT